MTIGTPGGRPGSEDYYIPGGKLGPEDDIVRREARSGKLLYSRRETRSVRRYSPGVRPGPEDWISPEGKPGSEG